MYRITASLALATLLTACGGGGGIAGSGSISLPDPAPTAGPLKKYEGAWIAPCENHSRETTSMVSANSGNTLQLNLKTEFYANIGCTGVIIATATYSGPVITLNFTSTVKNGSVKLASGETVTADVDVGSTVATGQTATLTGTGVTSRLVNGKTVWTLAFSEGPAEAQFEPVTGTGTGALLLRNGELWTLTTSGTSGTNFNLENRLTR